MSANMENTQKPCRYALATTSVNETKGMPQWGKGMAFLKKKSQPVGDSDHKFQENRGE